MFTNTLTYALRILLVIIILNLPQKISEKYNQVKDQISEKYN